ncbi:hypothetical protein L226DRAFT_560454 [Lentinus tigrinus ALCF2SS1-7]|uniref:Uncharacterized protein n=1 Tax=Lentinus tigrinus ALCF2SS1-6 TaxID=1328759 RepID=A0A5C2SA93_9APHY|nr:hypothetical protein L227DRAFT_653564 [Lentinus tigrinus ALCF2SS1-6]RPD74785.1 hypothetical protein L226DRAFT_560454 [Lentinus tigrinus ALCF2SS1-7]
MKSLSAPLVAVALLAAGASAQFQINTPNPPTQCVPTQFTWTGGTAPYFLVINPGGVTGAAALQQYSGLTGTSFTWSTNITAGTSIGLALTDATGTTVQSAPVTIQSGPDNSCLTGETSATGTSTGTGSTSAATSATGTTSAGTGTTSAAGTSGTATNPASGTSSRASGTSSGSGTATGSGSSTSASATGGSGSNGAASNVASAGIVGVLGAVAAALLA